MYIYYYGHAGSASLRLGFLQLWRVGALLCAGVWASHCSGFAGCCRARALECRLRSCGSRAWLLRGRCCLPGLGIELVFLALAGGFPTTGPTRKSSPETLIYTQNKLHSEHCLMNTRPQTVVLKLEYVSKSTEGPGKTQITGLQPWSFSFSWVQGGA